MYTILMIFFVFLCFILAGFVLIQQGKGDLGLGSLGGNQALFGGSGGQEFFERATWIMGAMFILGALGLTILKSRELRTSVLSGVKVKKSALKKPVSDLDTKALPQTDTEKTN